MADDNIKEKGKKDKTEKKDKKKKKNKKTSGDGGVVIISDKGPSKAPIIFAAVMVIALAVIAGISIKIIKNHPADSSVILTKPTTTSAQTQTTQPQTTVPVTQAPRIVPDGEAAAFITGTYSLDGTVYKAGESGGSAVTISSGNGSTKISGLCSGMWLGILTQPDGKYLIDNESGSYIDFTEEAYSKLGVTSIPYDIQLPGDISSADFQRANVKLGDADAVCYGAKTDSGSIEIYTSGGELKQFVLYGSDSYPAYEVIINDFSPQVPENQLTTFGLAKSTSVFSFFSAISQ